MGWFDDITSVFSSDTETPADAPPVEAGTPDIGLVDSIFGTSQPSPELPVAQTVAPVAYADPSTMLSAHYSIGNLSATSQPVTQANLPSTTTQLSNMQYLADTLEMLDSEVGPFSLLSSFRTKELQNLLAAAGEPTASGTSFHELGRAVDITPTTMGITEMFGRILANSDLKNRFVEIAIKPSQNALHLAVNVPDDTRTPKVLGLNADNVYKSLSAEEILPYITPYMPAGTDITEYADDLAPKTNVALLLGIVAAIGGVIYMSLGKAKRRGTL